MSWRPRRWLVSALLVVATLSAGAPVQSATGQESLTADSVLIEIDLQSDGDAVWRIEYRYRLDDENETRAFRALRDRIQENRSRYTGRFADRIGQSVGAAQNSTGRPMALTDVSVTTGQQAIPQGTAERGSVTYEFTWENFSVANDTHVRAGDAIHGFYVSPKTKLLVTWPDSYERARPILPEPDETGRNRAVWQGETDFASDEPTIVVEAASTDPAGDDGTVTPTDTAGGQSSDTESSGFPLLLVLAGAAVLGGVGASGVVAMRMREEATDEDADDATGDEESVPPELMSNEERVHAALEANGGRMKQQELAEACDWHPSKTSKVVNDLKEDGSIEVFRLGRENIVSLPGEGLDDE